MAKQDSRDNSSVLVIGLGRFGASTASNLMKLGRQVMAVERNPEAVTSKGGTTHAAIETFRAHNLDDIVFRAGTAAVERGKEMERENAE